MASDLLDEALGRLAPTGPEFGGGLSNHGPMAAEALVCLGRPAEVEPWVDRYLRRLDDAPRAGDPIDDANWREALGDVTRVADWTEYLRRQLAEAPWREVLDRWWPRLLPGIAAGATHGVIRTAHAARSLSAAETAARRDELARGLAYWAARYVEIPGARPAGTLPAGTALPAVPTLAGPAGRLITDRLRQVGASPGFAAATAALRPPSGSVDAALAGLTRVFAELLLDRGRAQHIAFIHAVTAPTAVRSILPLIAADLHVPTYEALWLTGAAIHAGYSGLAEVGPLPTGAAPAPDDLADRAIANGDEHAIKLTEACLRECRNGAQPIYLRAADATLRTHFPTTP
jgi:Questin oxidase-like